MESRPTPGQPSDGRPPAGEYHAGRDLYAAGRDIHHNVRVTNDYDPSDEVFQGRGIGRLLAVIGGVIALGGFCLLADFIYRAATIGGTSNLFGLELAPGVPQIPVGFGAFLAGGILSGIGTGMSKAARKRASR